jgi:hypothetical protein
MRKIYLLALEEVDGTDFIVDFLEVECDPDAPRARRAEVGIEDGLFCGSVSCHCVMLFMGVVVSVE